MILAIGAHDKGGVRVADSIGRVSHMFSPHGCAQCVQTKCRISLHGAAQILLTLLLLSHLCARAHAEDVAVISGGQVMVLSTDAKMEVTSQPSVGAAYVEKDPSNSGPYKLIYAAPRQVSTDVTASIGYKLDGVEKTAAVRVTAGSQPPLLNSEGLYTKSFKALFVLFIIATILESGLAVIFNWRPFLLLFDSRGVKTVVSVAFAYFFVNRFNLDIITSLINVYVDQSYPTSFAGEFVTSLIIAGGSSAVNGLLVSFGFRSVRTTDQVMPKPVKTEGWVSVTFKRKTAIGPVTVSIGDGNPLTTVAVIPLEAKGRSPFLRYFLKDPTRVPSSGGRAIAAGNNCIIELEDTNGSKKQWGPHAIAGGAIIDVVLEL